jgi:acetolactate synthase-1/2/3 large subunit
MYTNQALWTMVREQLDITVIIVSNRRYAILEMEFARTGARGGVPGSNASRLLDISNPVLDFAALAQSMGMKAAVATNATDFDDLCAEAFAHKGPFLIDAQIE